MAIIVTVIDELYGKLLGIVPNEWFSVNVEEDNETIKYLQLDGGFTADQLIAIATVLKQYEGKNCYTVVSKGS